MKKYSAIAIVFLFIVFGGIAYLANEKSRVSHLEAPLLKKIPLKSSKKLAIYGTAFPKSKVLIYDGDQYVDDVIVGEGGSFAEEVFFDTEGSKTIKVKQIYGNIISEFSDNQEVFIDFTAPDKNLFKLETKIPDVTRENSLIIKGYASPNDFVLIGETKYPVDKDGKFEINLSLEEGNNELKFAETDDVSNRTETIEERSIKVDTLPPVVSALFAMGNKPTEESVVVDIGDWQGYLDSVTSVAITGSIQGDIKKLTIDGKNIAWDENNKIYQRINLFIYGGLNKYKVVAEDMAGNIGTGYVQTTSQRDKDEVNLNINE